MDLQLASATGVAHRKLAEDRVVLRQGLFLPVAHPQGPIS
jgi:hypothetical protein